MRPTKKSNKANTYHRDGTVSYWSNRKQAWQRHYAWRLLDETLAAMSHAEVDKVRAVAAKFWGTHEDQNT